MFSRVARLMSTNEYARAEGVRESGRVPSYRDLIEPQSGGGAGTIVNDCKHNTIHTTDCVDLLQHCTLPVPNPNQTTLRNQATNTTPQKPFRSLFHCSPVSPDFEIIKHDPEESKKCSELAKALESIKDLEDQANVASKYNPITRDKYDGLRGILVEALYRHLHTQEEINDLEVGWEDDGVGLEEKYREARVQINLLSKKYEIQKQALEDVLQNLDNMKAAHIRLQAKCLSSGIGIN
ncbi:hypothetical protein QAD02_000025 [Eretmocerus hayati]|uniref:Uncharacterized protein n=1 Tax=Eretmocerus hayati TaxID=131215 RepID=A0ACC2NCE8_9HYME|nr:hypothetical protein QAD02_000025 [Eretmocerus hayati]